jgi:PAS domain-containing protein
LNTLTSLDFAADAVFQVAIDSAASGVVVIDAGGTIVLVNRELERQFGYQRRELVGLSGVPVGSSCSRGWTKCPSLHAVKLLTLPPESRRQEVFHDYSWHTRFSVGWADLRISRLLEGTSHARPAKSPHGWGKTIES